LRQALAIEIIRTRNSAIGMIGDITGKSERGSKMIANARGPAKTIYRMKQSPHTASCVRGNTAAHHMPHGVILIRN